MTSLVLIKHLALSMALGLLVGLQRERTQPDKAGIRTFPLITMFGTLSAILTQKLQTPWILVAGFIGMISILVIESFPKVNQEKPEHGVTTEIAMLVMFATGAMLTAVSYAVSIAVTGAVTLLLYLKIPMHRFVTRLGEKDLRAMMQFVLISFVILPILPNQSYDPFGVLNPYEVWWMVVLVVGISLAGYVGYKFLGREVGILLGAIIGGTVSSTATTMSYARRTKDTPEAFGLATIVILIASSITYLRVLLEIAVTAPSFLPNAAIPLLTLFGTSCLLGLFAWLRHRGTKGELPEQSNPTELKAALIFALLYALVVLGIAAGKKYLVADSLYVIAALSGLTDMDAITLSTSRLVRAGQLKAELGWRLIVVATMANLFFKAGIVAVVGEKRLLKELAIFFGLAVLSAVLVLWLF